MRRVLGLTVALAAMVAGCSPTALEDRLWRCETHADCGTGWLCSTTKGHCVAALNNEHGVFDDKIIFGMSADVTPVGVLGEQ